MKNIQIIIALLIIGAGFSCTKTTIAEGTITDAATGLPIPGVSVELKALSGGKVIDIQRGKTNNDGQFGLDIAVRKARYIFLRFGKEGYGEVAGLDLENGDKLRNIEEILYPYDAIIALEMVNASGASEFYHRYTGEFYMGKSDYGPLRTNTLKQGQGASTTEYVKVLGGGQVDIIWDTKSASGNSGTNKHSVFCPRNDTTYVKIEY